MQTVKPPTAKTLEWERLRRELLLRIVRSEAQRRAAPAAAPAK
jgi:hypothetical protein